MRLAKRVGTFLIRLAANRLLHAPLTGKRPWCMAILGANADELFAALYRQENFRGYAFEPREETEVETDSGSKAAATGGLPLVLPQTAPPAVSNGAITGAGLGLTGRRRLQTGLPSDKLQKRLTKIYREQRTLEEEQGLSTLFVALGFLKWFDSPQSEEPSFAPLILVPVILRRVQGRDGYVLTGRDDDIVVNVSLQKKLRESFDLLLPEIPEGDEWLPTGYFASVTQAISRQNRFEVDPSAIGVGFFSFSKFMMWRDLDPSVWRNGSLLEHGILKALLGEAEGFAAEPPIAADDEPIDQKIDLSNAVHVLDADSSQAIVIDEARNGRNLVVQGPPGTGKSQTIANIIASGVYAGRTVLFVAEKIAALQVVHDRLKRAGLNAICLELHSRKANKREVLKSLEEAIRLSGSTRSDRAEANRLASCRDKLNDFSNVINGPIGQSDRTPFQLMGTQLKLAGENARLLQERLDIAADWAGDKITAVERATDRAAAAVAKLLVSPHEHPWHGTGLDDQSPFDLSRLTDQLRAMLDKLEKLSRELNTVFSRISGGHRDPSLNDGRDVVKALRHIAAAPSSSRSSLKEPAWVRQLDKIEAVVAKGQAFSQTSRDRDELFQREAWRYDTGPLLLALRADGPSFFRRLGRRYRQGRAELRALCKEKPPKKLEDCIALIEKLRNAQISRDSFSQEAASVSAALAGLKSLPNPWDEAAELVEWTRAALSLIGSERLAELAARTEDPQVFATFADQLGTTIERVDEAATALVQHVKADFRRLFDVPNHQLVSVSALRQLISQWLDNIDKANDWASTRKALETLKAEGPSFLADHLEFGRLRPHEASSVLKLLIAEALWRRAIKDKPPLADIDGGLRTELVTEFRALDTRRIQNVRHEVLTKYLDQKPNGYAGEMGVIRGQIERKRGHFPVRKLIDQAGAAMQRLKPVFLMSPLSVAQFLPPGRLAFDMLVIDEASQVAPEDALGAVARAKQVIVVGDHKQLPPTNFFKMVNAGEDETGEDDEEGHGVDKSSDYESILTLARARGIAERMLAWHYRSKHPSLIALSNDECYGGRLLLPPSPFVQTTEFGLSLVRTPRGHYDRGGTSRDLVQAEQVAKAIATHVQRCPTKSLGVACLSVQQRDAVEDMIDKLGIRAEADTFTPKGERLFVKNLEAVQGDERDVIFISVGYGVSEGQSKPFLNFGPVSREGGDRRLNVLASRAREKCVVFSSISAGDIPADSVQRGTGMLRSLLHFAETGKLGAGGFDGEGFDSPFEEAVARFIREAGYHVYSQVGVSSFRIDLGVIDPVRPGEYILGVECDGATYHSARSARDRDRLRQEVLEGLGWRLHRIWSTDWFRNPKREKEKLIDTIQKAADRQRAAAVDVDSADTAPADPEPVDEPLASSTLDVEDGATDRNQPSNLEDYKECALAVPVKRSLLELSKWELARLSQSVVEEEGPIHTEEVARRIREAFGLQKTGSRILLHVKDSLSVLSRDGSLARDGEFWSIAGREVLTIRSRRGAAMPLRKASMISPAEYRIAILTALDEAAALSRDDLTIQTARLFGFDRTGTDLKQGIECEVEALIRAGTIIEDGGRLRSRLAELTPPRPPGTEPRTTGL
jgi:very-short-patch-repair endonuclease